MRKVHIPVFALWAVGAAAGLRVAPCTAGPPHFGVPEPSGQGSRSTPQWPRITPNLKNVDIRELADTVRTVTGKNLVIDPAVHGEVTLVCSASLTPSAFYEVFLAILDAHGWRAVPDGAVVKVVPAPQAPRRPVAGTPDEIMTEVVAVKNVSVARLAPVIQPLLSADGRLMAYTPANFLVFSDHVSHRDRLVRIIHRLDARGNEDLQIPPEESAPSNP